MQEHEAVRSTARSSTEELNQALTENRPLPAWLDQFVIRTSGPDLYHWLASFQLHNRVRHPTGSLAVQYRKAADRGNKLLLVDRLRQWQKRYRGQPTPAAVLHSLCWFWSRLTAELSPVARRRLDHVFLTALMPHPVREFVSNAWALTYGADGGLTPDRLVPMESIHAYWLCWRRQQPPGRPQPTALQPELHVCNLTVDPREGSVRLVPDRSYDFSRTPMGGRKATGNRLNLADTQTFDAGLALAAQLESRVLSGGGVNDPDVFMTPEIWVASRRAEQWRVDHDVDGVVSDELGDELVRIIHLWFQLGQSVEAVCASVGRPIEELPWLQLLDRPSFREMLADEPAGLDDMLARLDQTAVAELLRATWLGLRRRVEGTWAWPLWAFHPRSSQNPLQTADRLFGRLPEALGGLETWDCGVLTRDPARPAVQVVRAGPAV